MTLDGVERALSAAGIGESRTEAYILAEHFLKIPKSRLVLMRGEELLSDGLSAAVERRINREPLAYILGSAYFMNEEYEVSPDCLIPRPETEQLVCRAAELLPHGGRSLFFHSDMTHRERRSTFPTVPAALRSGMRAAPELTAD